MAVLTEAQTVEADFKDIRDVVPITVTFDGEDFVGVRSLRAKRKRFTPEGSEFDYDFTVRLLESDLAAENKDPEALDEVTVEGIIYTIIDPRQDAFLVIRTLDLGYQYDRGGL